MKRSVVILLALLAIAAAVPGFAQDEPIASLYTSALRMYRSGDHAGAAAVLETIVARDEKDPITLKSRYFLARSYLQLRRFQDASSQLMDLYSLSRAFYREWGCDHLLGEARRGLGAS